MFYPNFTTKSPKNSSSMYMTGGYYDATHLPVKSTTRKPSMTTKALFQTVAAMGEITKGVLVEVICIVNRRPFHQGFASSTIAYHTNLGRLNREVRGGRSYFSLTTKGREYINSRNLLDLSGPEL